MGDIGISLFVLPVKPLTAAQRGQHEAMIKRAKRAARRAARKQRRKP